MSNPSQYIEPSALAWAQENLAAGIPAQEVLTAMTDRGWTEPAARRVLEAALATPVASIPATAPVSVEARRVVGYAGPTRSNEHKSANASVHVHNMGYGAVLLVIGLAITLGTMSMGGVTVLAWGPILFGAIKLISGFVGWLGSR